MEISDSMHRQAAGGWRDSHTKSPGEPRTAGKMSPVAGEAEEAKVPGTGCSGSLHLAAPEWSAEAARRRGGGKGDSPPEEEISGPAAVVSAGGPPSPSATLLLLLLPPSLTSLTLIHSSNLHLCPLIHFEKFEHLRLFLCFAASECASVPVSRGGASHRCWAEAP